MWSYGAKYFAWCFARTNRASGVQSPYSLRWPGKVPDLSKARRFGCLAYAKDYSQKGKLVDRFIRGIFLGISDDNGAFLIGMWKSDNRSKSGLRFSVFEVRKCKFAEDYLVKNVDDLKPGAKQMLVDYPDPKLLVECDIPDEPVVSSLQNCDRSAKGPGKPEVVEEIGKSKTSNTRDSESLTKRGGKDETSETLTRKCVRGGKGEPVIALDHDLENSNRDLIEMFDAPSDSVPQVKARPQKSKGVEHQEILDQEDRERILVEGPITKKLRGRPRKDPTDPKWAVVDKMRRAQQKTKKVKKVNAWRKQN